MMACKVSCLLLVAFIALVSADTYLHMPRGSNNRLDEDNRNVNNANRLFDSQNNNKGSYNQNEMSYYGGSILPVEWTNQHSSGTGNAHVNFVIQYMLEKGTSGLGIRDGQSQDTIDPEEGDLVEFGRHESAQSYLNCAARQRNQGLFIADQNLNADNEVNAIYSRQNTNGNRHGLECPEERDYYPYWAPTEWVDAAILTTDVSRCAYYQAESQNVKSRFQCEGTSGLSTTSNGAQVPTLNGAWYIDQAQCEAAGFTWTEVAPNGAPAPDCLPAPANRDNHLGNTVDGNANTYSWTIPEVGAASTMVVRFRYNLSTNDYDPWNTFADQNGANSPIQDNPTVDIGSGINLKLALNTDQYGRTFQDRSSTFTVRPRPAEVPADALIYNLNVRGQRGNIVQNYPSVEYDFTPTTLTVTTEDYIHKQVTGSNTTPAGAGQGRESTDRSNFVEIVEGKANYPKPLDQWKMVLDPTAANYAEVRHLATLNQNDDEQDDAAPYQDFGLVRYEDPASSHAYMSTRNNNFSNRSQKGYVNVVPAPAAISQIALILIIVGSALVVVGGAGGAVAYGVYNKDSVMGRAVSKVTGAFGGGSSMPQGYAGPGNNF
jgi:hypothetical protein